MEWETDSLNSVEGGEDMGGYRKSVVERVETSVCQVLRASALVFGVTDVMH